MPFPAYANPTVIQKDKLSAGTLKYNEYAPVKVSIKYIFPFLPNRFPSGLMDIAAENGNDGPIGYETQHATHGQSI